VGALDDVPSAAWLKQVIRTVDIEITHTQQVDAQKMGFMIRDVSRQ
jgi:hypothetical protein